MIHTTQGSVIKAYKTLNRLCEEKMPVRLAYSLFSMRKSTESFYSFQVEREQEIFKEYVNGMENEALTFKTDEDKEKFVKEMTDLAQMEVDVNAEIVHIPLSMDMALTADDIGNLTGFVEFDEE